MKGYFKYIWKAVNQEYENMNPIIWGEYVYPGLGEFHRLLLHFSPLLTSEEILGKAMNTQNELVRLTIPLVIFLAIELSS